MSREAVIEKIAGPALWVSTVALVGSLVWLIAGGWWSSREALRGPRTWSATPAALVDTVAPTFEVETLDGDTLVVPEEGTRTLLIAYATTCRFCESSMASWGRVVEGVCERVRVVLVSAEPLDIQRTYWNAKLPLGGETCTRNAPVVGRIMDRDGFVAAYGLRGTPTHFVIDQGGHTRRTWQGALARRSAVDSMLVAFGEGG